ncbi:MAG: zinc ribbon domain-containing protein [Xenococcaceae cyanobacterium]
MAKAKTASFVTEIPLIASSQDRKILSARFDAARQLYNACLNEIVGDNTALLEEFGPSVDEHEKEIKRLQRKLERSRRANNPDNYEPNFYGQRGRKIVKKKGVNKKKKNALSQHCVCGHREKKSLRKRVHECPECGRIMQRDLLSAYLAKFVTDGIALSLTDAQEHWSSLELVLLAEWSRSSEKYNNCQAIGRVPIDYVAADAVDFVAATQYRYKSYFCPSEIVARKVL